MIKFLPLLTILFFASNTSAQNRTNIWELSYSDTLAYPDCGISFNSGQADTFTVPRTMAFFTTNASICDTNGNLLFYTNGVFVANKINDTLLNSTNFDTGWATTFYSSQGLGIDQGAIIIPFPESTSKYYIFYLNAELISTTNLLAQPLYLSYSVVDMDLDSGFGGIVANKKNIHLFNDTLTLGRMTAVKHANGRDWWIITHHYNSNKYYKSLVTPDSIYGPYEQTIGSIIPLGTDGDGQTVFSLDGSKFAMIGTQNILDYMNFDRCTGDFYNAQIIDVPNDSSETVGCSFSPDGRFLYVSSLFTLWQYDTWASDISSSAIKIGVYDNFTDDGIQVLFYMQILGADDKIYISTSNSALHLHVINSPDSLGTACNFTQHSFVLPQWNFNIPSFPNYDLGALKGSDCDSLNGIIQLPINNSSFTIYPNPALSQTTVLYNVPESARQVILLVYDITGRQIEELPLNNYSHQTTLDVSGFSAGIYLLELKTDEGSVVKKLVVE